MRWPWSPKRVEHEHSWTEGHARLIDLWFYRKCECGCMEHLRESSWWPMTEHERRNALDRGARFPIIWDTPKKESA